MAVYVPPVTFALYPSVQLTHPACTLGSKTFAIVVKTSTFGVGISTKPHAAA